MSLPGRWRWRDRPIFCELSIRETALATLIHQRRLTPSCGGQAPTAERTVGPARMIAESLTPKPGIREHNRHEADISRQACACPLSERSGHPVSVGSVPIWRKWPTAVTGRVEIPQRSNLLL